MLQCDERHVESEPLNYLNASVIAIHFYAFSSTRSSVDTIGSGKQPAVFVSVHVNALALKMELDTSSDIFFV